MMQTHIGHKENMESKTHVKTNENGKIGRKRGATHPFSVGFPFSHLQTPALMLVRPCGKNWTNRSYDSPEKTKKK
jgi:hypothetical protein